MVNTTHNLDFNNRINSFFNRHEKLTIKIIIAKKGLFKALYDKRFYNLKRYKREIPKGYLLGASNMETQAYYEPIMHDEQYYLDKKRIENETIVELYGLIPIFEELNTKYNFEIEVKE